MPHTTVSSATTGSTIDSACLAPAAAPWYALQAKPQGEQRAAANLTMWGVEVFLPQVRSAVGRRHGCQWRLRREPLFPGYLFGRFDFERMSRKVHYTRGVARILGNEAGPTPVDEGIIALIRSRIDDDGLVHLTPSLKAGDRVRITAGPLRDLTGIFESTTSAAQRVRLLLMAITGQVRVTIDAALVEKASVAAR